MLQNNIVSPARIIMRRTDFLMFRAVYIDINGVAKYYLKGGIIMYQREKDGFHPFGDEASAHGCSCTQQEQEKLLRQEAFNAGYVFAYYGEMKPYDQRFQEDWKRGYQSGEAAAMAE